MYELQEKRPLVGPFWAREFEVASKSIDDYYYVEEEQEGEKGKEQQTGAVVPLAAGSV